VICARQASSEMFLVAQSSSPSVIVSILSASFGTTKTSGSIGEHQPTADIGGDEGRGSSTAMASGPLLLHTSSLARSFETFVSWNLASSLHPCRRTRPLLPSVAHTASGGGCTRWALHGPCCQYRAIRVTVAARVAVLLAPPRTLQARIPRFHGVLQARIPRNGIDPKQIGWDEQSGARRRVAPEQSRQAHGKKTHVPGNRRRAEELSLEDGETASKP
jgi:hypothetical protein